VGEGWELANVLDRAQHIDDYSRLYCGGCLQVKENIQFYRHSGRRSGRASRCIECMKEYGVHYYLRNADNINISSIVNRKKRANGANNNKTPADDDLLGRHLRIHLRDAKARARLKNLSFTIGLQDLYSIYQEQNGVCAVSGRPMTLLSTIRRDPDALSIDRIDSAIGYEPNNIRFVLMRVNYMLGNFGLDATLVLCRDILSYQERKLCVAL